MALDYSPAYERSLDDARTWPGHRETSGITHRLDFGLIGDLTPRLRLNVRERLLKTPDLDLYAPTPQLLRLPETMTVTRRGDQLSHALDVTLDHDFSRRASLLLGVGHSLRKFEEEDLVDSEALDARIGAGFEVGARPADRGGGGRGAVRLQGAGRRRHPHAGSGLGLPTSGAAATCGWRLGRSPWTRRSGSALIVFPDPEGPPVVREAVTAGGPEGFRGNLQFSQERRFVRWALGLSHDVSPGSGLGRAVEADNAFVGLSFPRGPAAGAGPGRQRLAAEQPLLTR